MSDTANEDATVSLPRTYLHACLLLLLAEGGSHGYDLLEQVRGLGVAGADAGGIYRALRRMEREELVSSWWEPSPAGPARRTYELTKAGRADLERSMAVLGSTQRLMAGIVSRYEFLNLTAEAQ